MFFVGHHNGKPKLKTNKGEQSLDKTKLIMKKVSFFYSISPSTIKEEKKMFNIENLELFYLEDIFRGYIFVFLDDQRQYIKIKTPILHYLFQFQMVINEIEKGNYRLSTVSGDYYSNGFSYVYYKETDILRIVETNEREFDISINYENFKSTFSTFFKQTLEEIKTLYVELENNQDFINLDIFNLTNIVKTKNK